MGKTELLFAAFDAGGASALAPVIERLARNAKFRVRLAAAGPAKRVWQSRLSKAGLAISGSFRIGKPRLVVTGTGVHPFEKAAWKFWKGRGVRTLSVLDSWNRIADRYSSGGKIVRSDYVGAIDQSSRRELGKLGFPPSSIFIVGQPYLEGLLAKRRPLAGAGKLRKKLGIAPGEFVLLFASERFGRHYQYGYSEYGALAEVVRACKSLAGEGMRPRLLVKLHPEEKPGKYSRMRFPENFRVTLLGGQQSPREIIGIADLVCGCTSVILLEAAAMGKMALSVQPGLSVEDNCQASRMGVVRLVKERGELSGLLAGALIKRRLRIRLKAKKITGLSGSALRLVAAIGKILGA